MIITRNVLKSLLQMTGTDYDSFIDLNIPLIEETICNYCRNDFIDKQFDYFSSSNVSFVNSTNTIHLVGIENKKLSTNDSIRVYRSLRNNQTFTVDSVNTGYIILNSIDEITDEDEGEGVFITKINYPRHLKLIIAKMMNFLINDSNENKEPGIKSEKIDDYSITYEENYNGFPMSIMNALNNDREPYKMDLFNYIRSVRYVY